jgi:hypothetical protein
VKHGALPGLREPKTKFLHRVHWTASGGGVQAFLRNPLSLLDRMNWRCITALW